MDDFIAVGLVVFVMLAIIIRQLSQLLASQPKPYLEISRDVDRKTPDDPEIKMTINLCNQGDRVARIRRIFVQLEDGKKLNITKMGLGYVFACYLDVHDKERSDPDMTFNNGTHLCGVASGKSVMMLIVRTKSEKIKELLFKFTEKYKISVELKTGFGAMRRWTDKVLNLDGSGKEPENNGAVTTEDFFAQEEAEPIVEMVDQVNLIKP